MASPKGGPTMTIFEMLIDVGNVKRYIKAQFKREGEKESLVIISAHNSEKGGQNG